MEVMIIEKVHNNSDQFRKEREKMYIQKFNTKYKGMNQKTWENKANCICFFKFIFFLVHNFQLSINVLTFSSQSDVDIIKISKYITEEFIWLPL